MKYIILFIAVISTLVFNCTELSPGQFLWAGYITFLIPVALLVNLVIFFFLLLRKRYLCLIPLIVLILGFKYLTASFAINLPVWNIDQPTFSVLSYNVSSFKAELYEHERAFLLDKNSDSYKMLQWVKYNDADIKCFQEFYNHDSTQMFETVKAIAKEGTYEHYFSSNYIKWKDAYAGIAIFSKFPIVDFGEVTFKKGSVNRAAFADIAIYGDTIRIVNTHLQSMSLSPYNPLASESLSGTKHNLKRVYEKLSKGLIDRSYQAGILKELIHKSPYKVILVGDFNQTPYSYVYNSFKEFMENAFEQAGNGFGISYRGNTLFFLRIDNQFYDPELNAVDFVTHSEVPYSDHYPIEATYTLGE